MNKEKEKYIKIKKKAILTTYGQLDSDEQADIDKIVQDATQAYIEKMSSGKRRGFGVQSAVELIGAVGILMVQNGY